MMKKNCQRTLKRTWKQIDFSRTKIVNQLFELRSFHQLRNKMVLLGTLKKFILKIKETFH